MLVESFMLDYKKFKSKKTYSSVGGKTRWSIMFVDDRVRQSEELSSRNVKSGRTLRFRGNNKTLRAFPYEVYLGFHQTAVFSDWTGSTKETVVLSDWTRIMIETEIEGAQVGMTVRNPLRGTGTTTIKVTGTHGGFEGFEIHESIVSCIRSDFL